MCLNGDLHAVCLGELTLENIIPEVLGRRIITFDEIVDLSGTSGVFLVCCQEGIFADQGIDAVALILA